MSTAPRRSPEHLDRPLGGMREGRREVEERRLPRPVRSQHAPSARPARPSSRPRQQHRAALLGGDPTPHVHLRHPDRGHCSLPPRSGVEASEALSRTFQSTVAVATTAPSASVSSTSTEKSTRPSASSLASASAAGMPSFALASIGPRATFSVGDLGAPRERRHVAHPRREGADEGRPARRLGDPEERPGVLAADVVVELRPVGQQRRRRALRHLRHLDAHVADVGNGERHAFGDRVEVDFHRGDPIPSAALSAR